MKTQNSLAISLATALSLAIVTPAFGQIAPAPVGVSNVGGVNNSSPGGVPSCSGVINSQAGGGNSCGSRSFTTNTGYSTTVLEQAKALQQQLADAQSSRTGSGMRIFLRTPQAAPTNEKLTKAKADATAFLESIKNPGPNLLAAPATTTVKFNPTW